MGGVGDAVESVPTFVLLLSSDFQTGGVGGVEGRWHCGIAWFVGGDGEGAILNPVNGCAGFADILRKGTVVDHGDIVPGSGVFPKGERSLVPHVGFRIIAELEVAS